MIHINNQYKNHHMNNRRNFIKKSTAITIGLTGIGSTSNLMTKIPGNNQQVDGINIVGPKEGYTPEIGTLVSMMNWMRNTILRPVYGMSQKDLDYLHDENSNSIGAMLMHLVATERFYQRNTFENQNYFEKGLEEDRIYEAASNLGNEGRATFKGKELEYYLEKLEACREFTLNELSKYDDTWLEIVDTSFWGSPTNNYCKWFHVVEHESNHNGQIKYLKSRLHSNE